MPRSRTSPTPKWSSRVPGGWMRGTAGPQGRRCTKGAATRGWVVWQNQSNAVTMSTNFWKDVERPSLKITYKPRVANTSATGAGVTVAVIDSGIAAESVEAGRIKTSRDFTGGVASPAATVASDA